MLFRHDCFWPQRLSLFFWNVQIQQLLMLLVSINHSCLLFFNERSFHLAFCRIIAPFPFFFFFAAFWRCFVVFPVWRISLKNTCIIIHDLVKFIWKIIKKLSKRLNHCLILNFKLWELIHTNKNNFSNLAYMKLFFPLSAYILLSEIIFNFINVGVCYDILNDFTVQIQILNSQFTNTFHKFAAVIWKLFEAKITRSTWKQTGARNEN